MAKRIDWHELSRRAGPPFLALVLLTWAWAWKKGAERPEPDLYTFLKRAWPGAEYAPLARGVFEVKREGRTIGYAATGTASGYSGPLTLAVGTSPEGRIRSLAIIEYRDTPDLMRGATNLLGLLYRSPGATSYEVFAACFRLSGTGFQYAILGFVLATAVFVSRPFCNWLCPVDAVERTGRPLRVSVLRLMSRREGLARPRRPILLPVTTGSRPPSPAVRRLRNGLLGRTFVTSGSGPSGTPAQDR